MRRWMLILLMILLLPILSCAPLDELPDGLIAFTEVPADWGHLVAVTKYTDGRYYELWFSNPETGSLTHAPLYRATWQIRMDRVRTLPRGEAPAGLPPATGGGS